VNQGRVQRSGPPPEGEGRGSNHGDYRLGKDLHSRLSDMANAPAGIDPRRPIPWNKSLNLARPGPRSAGGPALCFNAANLSPTSPNKVGPWSRHQAQFSETHHQTAIPFPPTIAQTPWTRACIRGPNTMGSSAGPACVPWLSRHPEDRNPPCPCVMPASPAIGPGGPGRGPDLFEGWTEILVREGLRQYRLARGQGPRAKSGSRCWGKHIATDPTANRQAAAPAGP